MNRIREVVVRNRVLDPASSELWVTIVPEARTPATEVYGRLMGPRCPYATTVEVAYPLRPVANYPDRPNEFTRRVVIPEATLWDTTSPFLYSGPVQLWEGDRLADEVQVVHGLRALTLTAQGLRLNGQTVLLNGVRRDRLSEAEARTLHDRGINLVLARMSEASEALWSVADRFGLLVLGELDASDEVAIGLAESRWRWRPSFLGWLISTDLADDAERWPGLRARLQRGGGVSLGLRLAGPPTQPVPEEFSFLAGARQDLPPDDARHVVLLEESTGRNGTVARPSVPDEAGSILGRVHA